MLIPEPRSTVTDPLTGTPAKGTAVRSMRLAELSDEEVREWTRLFAEQSGIANPFCSPVWVSAWYRQYVATKDQRLLWVTDDGKLIGVAPMYVQQLQLSGLPVARRLALVGAGRTTPLELPQLLCAAGKGRVVCRAVVTHTLTEEVSWSELCVSREQGWFLPGGSLGDGRFRIFQRHQQVRACVVLRLEDSWPATRSALKRNIKESLRRSRNRLAKDGRPWQIIHRTGKELDQAAVHRLFQLHTARARYQGSSSRHHDAFAAGDVSAFMIRVLPELALANAASIVELVLDGQVVAAQLVLHPPGGIYFHSSGFLPEVWHLSPTTALQGAAVEAAIGRGDRWVNFSPGPNESKLRWSEDLHLLDDFAYGVDGGPGLARHTAFTVAKQLRQLRQRRRRPAPAQVRPQAPGSPAPPDVLMP